LEKLERIEMDKDVVKWYEEARRPIDSNGLL
jgi:hypothetical protein